MDTHRDFGILMELSLQLVFPGVLVAQWLALLTSDLEGPGSDPG
jgi:hypothetical protein